MEKAPICWFTFQVSTRAGTGLVLNQEQITQSISPMGMKGTQLLESSLPTPLGEHYQEGGIGSCSQESKLATLIWERGILSAR